MSRVSVIIPVYNVEKYLDWCLESLEAQTFGDFEAICVNDGSTDSSREILSRWEAKDSRFRVIDKENGGPSAARNLGIRSATSEYICSLDSDDRFHPNALEHVVRLLDRTGADVVTFGACCYPAEAGYPWLEGVLSPRDAIYEDFSPDLLFKEASRPFAWRTACRRDFLLDNGIEYVDGFGEDQVYHFSLYPRARKVVLSSAKLYDYRVSREGSLMALADVRGNVASKVGLHIGIVERILEDWERGDLLGRCPADLLDYVADFVINDLVKLGQEDYERAAADLRAVLGRYWSAEQVAALGLPDATRRLLVDACYGGHMAPGDRRRLVFDYYAQRYGRRAAVRHALRLD